jgi:hypothetical protein
LASSAGLAVKEAKTAAIAAKIGGSIVFMLSNIVPKEEGVKKEKAQFGPFP